MVKTLKSRVQVVLSISQATFSPQLEEIIRVLKESEVNCHILIMGTPGSPLLAEIQRLKIAHTILPNISKYGIWRHFVISFFLMLKHRPSVFLASGQYATFSGIPAAYFLRISKRIYIRHHSIYHHHYGIRIGIFLDRIMNTLSTKIVAVSKIVKNVLVVIEGVADSKVDIIYNGVDLNGFYNRKKFVNHESLRNTSPNKVFKIGAISRLTDWKGVEYTALAFCDFYRKYPNSHLHIVGASGDSSEKITKILEFLPTNSYHFEQQNFDVPSFLSSLDGFVHVPITPESEAFGIVYIEALATGVPCIFTISGILNELPNPEHYCSVVPYRSSDAILRQLEILYSGKQLKRPTAQDWLQQFTLKNQGASYLKLIS